MKNSRTRIANAEAKAAKRAAGKPALSKFEAKRRYGVGINATVAELAAHFNGENQ